jgi:long-chain fatty acid transport protein
MKKSLPKMALLLVCMLMPPRASATNGSNLIAVGPTSRSMGGVGIAQPMDAISAVFQNPAAMFDHSAGSASTVSFAGTLLVPSVSTRVTNPDGLYAATSEKTIYPVPAIGLTVPLGNLPNQWRFGFAAYGVTGMGVNYKGTVIDDSTAFATPNGALPLVATKYTNLSIMKFVPAIAYQFNPKWSIGFGGHLSYGAFDLGSGTSSGFGVGVQPSVLYKPGKQFSFGMSYSCPQGINHQNITDFDGDGSLDDFRIEAPSQIGIGMAWTHPDERLTAEINGKWIHWSQADGYSDMDWRDQWTLGIGIRYAVVRDKFFVTTGYNFGGNPLRKHSNWGNGSTKIQGKNVPNYYYETFRIVGFPAIVEHHLAMGINYRFSDRFTASIAYMHALENSMSETGSDLLGRPTTIKSDLSENGLDFALNWSF